MKNQFPKQKAIDIRNTMTSYKRLSLLIFISLLLGVTSVSAQDKSADQWQYDVTVYLYGATINQTTGTGDSITINFGTILKNLDFAGMTTFGARKNKFSMLADVIYMDLSDTRKRKSRFLGQPITGKVDIGLKSWVLNFVGGYNVFDNGKDIFDITAGARYIDVNLNSTIKLNDVKRKNSIQADVWDGVIGFKGRHNYPDGYYLNYYADVGGGGSSFTWQAVANFSYDYKKFTGVVGYRYIDWDFGKDTPNVDDMAIHGPYMGIKWSF
jgi:hypothetical protein